MLTLKRKDGFLGEKQINVPREIVINSLRKTKFVNNLFITHIGYFPNAKFHYRERQHGCPDNILIYCVAGKGHYQTLTESHTLNANQFMMLPAGKFHIYQADIHNPWSIYWVHFSGHQLYELKDWLKTEDYIRPTGIEYDNKIIDQWSEIYTALDNGFSAQNLAFANLCLFRLLSFFLCKPDIIPSIAINNPINESIAYMRANIDKSLSIDDLAGKLKYSNSHFTNLFKEKTGSSPIDYFINLKIHFACQLLSQTNYKVNIIAAHVGYSDAFYFSRLFKKLTGKSPKDYRKKAVSFQR